MSARTAAPKVKITNDGLGKREVRVDFGGYEDRPASESNPDFVHVLIASPDIDGDAAAQQGTLFIDLCLGTVAWDGKRSFEEFAGCIQPSQLDTLIAGLCFARDEAATLGLLTERRTAQ